MKGMATAFAGMRSPLGILMSDLPLRCGVEWAKMGTRREEVSGQCNCFRNCVEGYPLVGYVPVWRRLIERTFNMQIVSWGGTQNRKHTAGLLLDNKGVIVCVWPKYHHYPTPMKAPLKATSSASFSSAGIGMSLYFGFWSTPVYFM